MGRSFQSHDERRAYFRERLREHLEDPRSRSAPGFPRGSIDDILELSDPPYYTACPNPFFKEIVQHLGQAVRPSVSAEPFASDVSEGKNDPFYNAHSYHTKVPPRAIMRYILHYTQPGDLVLDGFCGTGMTGVAAQLCGDREAIEELGYRIGAGGVVLDDDGKAVSSLGRRVAFLNDISPAATFIASSYNSPRTTAKFRADTTALLKDAEARWGWAYTTLHAPTPAQLDRATSLLEDGPEKIERDTTCSWGRINYVIWSDIFACGNCSGEIVFWDSAVDKNEGKVRDEFKCPHCRAEQTKRTIVRTWETRFDDGLQATVRQAAQRPVSISYTFGKKRHEKVPDRYDLALIQRVARTPIRDWYPTAALPEGDKTGDPFSVGATHVHHFYTRRNLGVLAALRSGGLRTWLPFSALTPRATRMHRIAASRIGGEKKGVGGATVGVINGTLYIPSISVEMNVLEQASDRIAAIAGVRELRGEAFISTESTASTIWPDAFVDYIFTDPPFGGNLMYSELNVLWEGWLKVFTNNREEAIENDSQEKGLAEYHQLMVRSFSEYHRVLKPGRWMTVEFHNSKNSVWNSIQDALQQAGFVIADVRTLDKQQGTFNQVAGGGSVKQDLIISCYKPSEAFLREFVREAGTAEGAWEFTRDHLSQLPVPKPARDGKIAVIAERLGYLLYDRMVAFHLQRGLSIPMTASEYYTGLEERFAVRDGMYFLPEQCAAYDRSRASSRELVQAKLTVTDETSAVRWLRAELEKKPQTFGELQPMFMKEAATWAKHEKPQELLVLLNQNFVRYDGDGPIPEAIWGWLRKSSELRPLTDVSTRDAPSARLRAEAKDRWHVPDPKSATDLERVRERALAKEFELLVQAKGKIKQLRTEAVRFGFKRLYDSGDYEAISLLAARMPPAVIEEDPYLLMLTDLARARSEE